MARTGASFHGFHRFDKALDKGAARVRFRQKIRRATGIAAKLVEKKMRQQIVKGNFEPNKPLTVAIKQDEKPLVDRADLFQAITSKLTSYRTAFVGVLQTEGVHNTAVVVHEGKAIPVTDKMRGLFSVLWQVSEGRKDAATLSGRARELWERMPGGWFPLSSSTNVITIPSRPFVTATFADKALERKVNELWAKAIDEAIREGAGL